MQLLCVRNLDVAVNRSLNSIALDSLHRMEPCNKATGNQNILCDLVTKHAHYYLYNILLVSQVTPLKVQSIMV